MFKLIESQMIAPNIHLLTLEAPAVAREMKPGQFVIVRAENGGERIPLSLSDWDAEQGTVTVIVKNVGSTTDRLASLEAGVSIPTVVGPLGNPTEIEEFGTVLCLGGCYGIGSIFPIARALKERKNKVIAVIEARSSYLLFWEEKLAEVSDELIFITRDGTRGLRGHVGRVTEIIKSSEPVNRIIINGCTFLLKRGSDVSRPFGIKTIVSLNPIMIDGTGMCGVCRVTVGSTTKFACVHGPDFDGHQVNWAELLQRRKTYMREEVIPLRTSRCEEHAVTMFRE
ncbi:ferredoxin-NADP reductase [candidate division WOR-1 bacterium DG_54_3]|uniref:Ferredoxin-NADP reductase n=1 Tax=candidate division WOR-1 bacterium DG_54_3 TaxID=1703775 RepID=A0A0S7XKJ7_UNCSA|nr:MAG: ferredoxin-NADP reductase [candidate division WOR-1 bacterium DG_54_3]